MARPLQPLRRGRWALPAWLGGDDGGTGTVGLVVVGLGGVGSSLLTGVLAARAHLVHPSKPRGGRRIRKGAWLRPSPLRAAAPAGRAGRSRRSAHSRCARDRSLSRRAAGGSHQPFAGGRAAPELRKIHAMIGGRQAPTRRHLADALAEDLRGFLAHHRCARGVVVCTIPGVRADRRSRRQRERSARGARTERRTGSRPASSMPPPRQRPGAPS